jgi:hypothetical protein
MKKHKQIAKLALQRETLRVLTKRELDKAAGGYIEDSSCTAKTKMISGCASIVSGDTGE